MLVGKLESQWIDADPPRGLQARRRRLSFDSWVDGACGGSGPVLLDLGVEEVRSADWPFVLCWAFVCWACLAMLAGGRTRQQGGQLQMKVGFWLTVNQKSGVRFTGSGTVGLLMEASATMALWFCFCNDQRASWTMHCCLPGESVFVVNPFIIPAEEFYDHCMTR